MHVGLVWPIVFNTFTSILRYLWTLLRSECLLTKGAKPLKKECSELPKMKLVLQTGVTKKHGMQQQLVISIS